MRAKAILRDGVEVIYKPVFSKAITRPLIAWRVQTGFPSPAEDYIEGSLDLAKHLVKTRWPPSTSGSPASR